jgi:hypothetical protein
MKKNKIILLLLFSVFSFKNVNPVIPKYTSKQYAQFSCATIKFLTRLYEIYKRNQYAVRCSQLQKAEIASIISSLAHGGCRALDWDSNSKLQKASSAGHVGLSIARTLKSRAAIRKLNEIYDMLANRGVCCREREIDALNMHGFHGGDSLNFLSYLFAIAEFASSTYCIHSDKKNKKNIAIAEMVRGLSDVVPRFLLKKGLYEPKGALGKIETALSVFPYACDVIKAVEKLLDSQNKKKKKKKGDKDSDDEDEKKEKVSKKICGLCRKNLRDGDILTYTNCSDEHNFFHSICLREYYAAPGGGMILATKDCPCCENKNRYFVNTKKYVLKEEDETFIPVKSKKKKKDGEGKNKLSLSARIKAFESMEKKAEVGDVACEICFYEGGPRNTFSMCNGCSYLAHKHCWGECLKNKNKCPQCNRTIDGTTNKLIS